MQKSVLVPWLVLALAGGTIATSAPAAPPPGAQPTLEVLAARIKALEESSQQLREQAAAALAAAKAAQAELASLKSAQQQSAVAAVSEPAAAAPQGGSGIGTGNAFNPAISVILNGFYTDHSNQPNASLRRGFPIIGEGGPLPQGFSLGESEVSLAANIDDKFYGQMTVTAESEDGEDHFGVEEAYVDTTALPDGFGARAGRFYSNIGYLNSHHAHTDFFSVRPFAYQAFLGNQYGDDGVQLQWVAPTDLFLQFGTEAFRGDNYPAAGASNGGLGAHTFYVHAGGDVGIQNAWFAGLSMLRTNTHLGDDGYSGRDTVYIADGTWKWSPHGNFKDGGFMLRGEYLADQREGRYAAPAEPLPLMANADPLDTLFAQPWIGTRRGMYAEGVYRFDRTWEAGYRYDKLWGADDAGPYASAFDPVRNSLMLTWHNSEFSLVRLQVSHDRPSDNSLILQYQTALGAHGAHKF
ncbi:MAG TPA: hypothetical protein VFG55_03005 [Rhodanobacteraceae bacterium]|nr:hypothetical protein [Rhodanobacteraceae bacterium]